ncbi:ribonuclease H-like domain-containing protein [Whalleya microplaca]|nr:ribonuclease H-like domain-containing protein [Whalleya microplaca]
MAQELSSNWKKLQAKIKAESSTNTNTSPGPKGTAAKRKASDTTTSHTHPKRQKLHETSKQKQRPPPSKTPKATHHTKAKPPPTKQMGITQSSAITKGTSATITPSLALWAEDNDISAEDLAEAYALGVKGNASLTYSPEEQRARINEGLAPNIEVGKYIALDCEMVGIGTAGRESALARVSAVDYHGRQVYDSFVAPREPVTDWRTAITGLSARQMAGAGARPFGDVQEAVAGLLRGRILVGHDLRHDLAALQLTHPTPLVRDTARFSGYRRYGHGPKPALRVLAREVLGVEIQTGHHSSIEDARVAMLLFRRKKAEFDVEHANRFGLPANETGASKGAAKPKAQGKKKKKKH